MILKAWAIINGKGEYWWGRSDGPEWCKDKAFIFWSGPPPQSYASSLGGMVVELAILRVVKGGEVGEDQEA